MLYLRVLAIRPDSSASHDTVYIYRGDGFMFEESTSRLFAFGTDYNFFIINKLSRYTL